MSRFDCSQEDERAAGVAAAVAAVRRGELVVLPTDTVYGVGADAFTASAVTALLEAKGRARDMPVPVLVGSVRTANALVEEMSPYGSDLIEAFWPGALTIVCRHSSTLQWDLGETRGTVALRMPLQRVALEVLAEAGPMGVSSANRSGLSPAITVDEAMDQLGDSIAVCLDAGTCAEPVPSSIVDVTGPVPRLLREGAIPTDKLREVVDVLSTEENQA